MNASRTRRIPRTGTCALRMYKSGAFSQNTPGVSSRSSKAEPPRRLPLSAPNAREKLSGSAAVLFQRFGYVRVSIRDITSSVDVPKGAFYNHFKSKEALASAIVSQHFDALLETLTEGGSQTAPVRLRRHFESLVPSMQKRGASPLLLISTLAAEGPALPSALVQQIAEGLQVWSNRIAALISARSGGGANQRGSGPASASRSFHQLLARCRDSLQMRPCRPVRLSAGRA